MKRKVFALINIIVSLVIGCIIYLTVRDSLILLKLELTVPCFRAFRKLVRICYIPKSILGKFLVYNLTDFLWAYAIGWTISHSHRKPQIIIASISILALEFAQKFCFVTGTFDVLDIIVEFGGMFLGIFLQDKLAI